MSNKFKVFLLAIILLFPLAVNIAQNTLFVQNPVISDFTVHDASVIKIGSKFYAFASYVAPRDTTIKIKLNSVSIFVSDDLQNWKFYKSAIASDEERCLCEGKRNGYGVYYQLWAPDIIMYKGKLLLFVSMRHTFEDSKIAVFESDAIEKDFSFKNVVVSNNPKDIAAYFPSNEIIDPCPLVDGGKLCLTFGSFARDGSGKFIENRKNIGTYLVKLKKGKKILMKGSPKFLSDYYEGVNIIKRNKDYFLFGTNGYWINHTYKVEYSKSRNLEGPYLNGCQTPISDTANVNLGTPILFTPDKDLRFNGFGCMSGPVVDSDGRYWVLVHGHDLSKKAIREQTAVKERYTFLIELLWDKNGNPYFDMDAIQNNKLRTPNFK